MDITPPDNYFHRFDDAEFVIRAQRREDACVKCVLYQSKITITITITRAMWKSRKKERERERGISFHYS